MKYMYHVCSGPCYLRAPVQAQTDGLKLKVVLKSMKMEGHLYWNYKCCVTDDWWPILKLSELLNGGVLLYIIGTTVLVYSGTSILFKIFTGLQGLNGDS